MNRVDLDIAISDANRCINQLNERPAMSTVRDLLAGIRALRLDVELAWSEVEFLRENGNE